MFTRTTRLAALAICLSAGAAAAQETGTGTATVAEELDLGTPIQAEPQVGESYTREQIGDWTLRCIRSEAEDRAQDPCRLTQLLSEDPENPSPVAEFSLFRLPDGGKAAAGATLIVPLETLLTAGARISVDGGQPKVYPYRACDATGCFAQIGLTAEDVAAYKRGASATLTIVPARAPDQVVTLALSLTGFTKGYDTVTVAAPNQ